MSEHKTIEEIQKGIPEMTLEELKLWARSICVREKEIEHMMRDPDPMDENMEKEFSSEEMMKQLVDEKYELERKLKKHGLTLFEVINAFERTGEGMKDSVKQYIKTIKK